MEASRRALAAPSRVRGRSTIAKAVLSVGLVGAISVAMTAPASANAPNPVPATTTSIQPNGNGSVTVTLSGVWSWDNQPSCETRFGVGWTVDWTGLSPIATASGARGAFQLRPSQLYFHVSDTDMVAAGNVHRFTGPCTDADRALGGPGLSGAWSASHVYPNADAIPQRICANFYDLHGTPGNLFAGQADPLTNSDNSIRTNGFDPSAGAGFCYSRPHSDNVAPVVTGAPDRAPNDAGWYNAPVTITWTSVDPAPSSGAPNQPDPTIASTEGSNRDFRSSLSCDPVLNCAFGSTALSIDLTPPNLTYEGNSGPYTVDQYVSIACTAIDALSGVAASSCAAINTEAYNLLGTHTFSASATDAAGNTSTGSTTVTVTVTAGSLANLTRTLVSDPKLARELTAPLVKAKPNPKDYIKKVQAQSGKKISRPTADLLISLARDL